MKVTKQRKIVATFFGLSALAFLGDRLWLQPAGAGAAPPPPTAPESENADDAQGSGAGPARGRPTGPALAQRLNTVAPSGDDAASRDPFRKEWEFAAAASATTEDGAAPATAAQTVKEFVSAHPLKGVWLPRSGAAKAFIGKKTYAVGDEVDGWTLVTVEEKSAVLTRGEDRITLDLKSAVLMRGESRVTRDPGPDGREER